jgi:hypothetical protein
MSQINPLENVITHERTFYLDTANVSRAESLAGWYLKIIDVSSANVKIKLRVDNEQTEAKTMKLGAGWRHRWFERLVFDWDAQPGEWITVEYGGNPATYRPELYESFVPSVTTSVEISNTVAQRVPVELDEPISVTQATDPWIVTQDQTPQSVDDWLPAGASVVQINTGTWFTTADTLIHSATAGKTMVVTDLTCSGVANRTGKIWIDDGAGNVLWTMSVVGGVSYPLNLSLQAGYRIYGRSYYDNLWISGSGYEY